MPRKAVQREIPEPRHTGSPFFYGMEREDKKQPMTDVIRYAIAGYQARYGTDERPRFLVCNAGLASELGDEHEGMQVCGKSYVHPTVVYVGALPPV